MVNKMICDKEKCTGCFACYNICPKNAIKMEEDEHGFIYPNYVQIVMHVKKFVQVLRMLIL